MQNNNVIYLNNFVKPKIEDLEKQNLEIFRSNLKTSINKFVEALIDLEYQSFKMSPNINHALNLSDCEQKNLKNSLILASVEKLLSNLEY